jgi:hypothetical protein
MDQSKFKETEHKYAELKERLNHGELTPEEMKKELKKMMVLDENGNYWMIGGKTGKWYSYNGTDWKEGDPFTEESPAPGVDQAEQGDQGSRSPHAAHDDEAISVTQPLSPAVTVSTESETIPGKESEPVGTTDTVLLADNDTTGTLMEEKSERTVVCKICRTQIPYYSVYCHVCGANQKDLATASKTVKKTTKPGEMVITSINIASLIFFLGGLGLLLGVLVGAAFGIIKDLFPFLQEQLPRMLNDTRGGVAGGLVFAAIGGIGGFIIAAAAAAFITSLYNLLSYLFGGIRFQVKQ